MTYRSFRRSTAIRLVVLGGFLTLTLAAVAGCGSTSSTAADGILAAGLRAQTAGNISEATSDYNQVLAINPKNQYAYYNLGLIAQQAHNNATADSA